MNKKLTVLSRVLVIAITMVLLLTTVVSAGAPYSTYTYSSNKEILYSPDAYVPETVVDSSYMGLEVPVSDPADLAVDGDDNVYLVDRGTNRVIVLDPYYKVKFVIETFINEWGVPDTFNAPSGVYVNDSRIYVADTDNNRIVIFDRNGKYEKVINRPDNALFTSTSSLYKPVALAVDQYGRLFIVSSTTYQGVIVMSEDGDFYGFIGAQKVSLTLWERLKRMFQTDEQRMYSKQNVSTEFNNIAIDADNFLYVTISSIEEEDQQGAIDSKDKEAQATYAPVKKINASGTDIMRRNGFWPPSGEIKVTSELADTTATITGASTIIDAAVGPEGTWSIIDQKRSKVYTYDEEGELLFIFGDVGSQKGMIEAVESITYQSDKILLLDSYYDTFTVYRRTEYGDILLNAIHNQNERNYDSAYEDWLEVLKRNNNFDAAYIGVGKALSRSGEYEASLEYFKAALETEQYSVAYKEIRKEWMSKFFLVIILAVIVVCVVLGKFMGFAAVHNRKVALKIGRKTLKDELLYVFYLILHPFDGFWDLKHENRGSARSGFVLLIITILAFFYKSVGTGYIFNPDESSARSIFTAILAIVVPVLLWTVGNWCMTTLMEGEGTLKDIFVATSYALVPAALMTIVSTLLSNVLLFTEGDILTLIEILGYVWTALLLVFGTMVTHDYSMGKNIGTVILSIVGMVFIMFLAILFTTLMTKIFSFVYNIVVEIQYRM